jgi:hypothetical protein
MADRDRTNDILGMGTLPHHLMPKFLDDLVVMNTTHRILI